VGPACSQPDEFPSARRGLRIGPIQVAVLTQKTDRWAAQLEEAEADPKKLATHQAVSLRNQAQQLGDFLVDEFIQSARDLLVAARSHSATSRRGGKMAATRATAIAETASSEDASP
jgi:hypothetical protein